MQTTVSESISDKLPEYFQTIDYLIIWHRTIWLQNKSQYT
jgi:hypothetical protein